MFILILKTFLNIETDHLGGMPYLRRTGELDNIIMKLNLIRHGSVLASKIGV